MTKGGENSKYLKWKLNPLSIKVWCKYWSFILLPFCFVLVITCLGHIFDFLVHKSMTELQISELTYQTQKELTNLRFWCCQRKLKRATYLNSSCTLWWVRAYKPLSYPLRLRRSLQTSYSVVAKGKLRYCYLSLLENRTKESLQTSTLELFDSGGAYKPQTLMLLRRLIYFFLEK